MRTYLILSLFVWGFMACQADTSSSNTSETEQTAITKNTHLTDSIVQSYQQQLTTREEVFPLNCNPEAGKINPADGAPKDTLFFLFREQLKTIVANKDIFALLPFVSENIKTGFGAEGGLQDFIRMWELDSPDKIPNSTLWPTLESLLALGGQFHNYDKAPYFEAPYLGPCWPHTAEPYEFGAVIGAGVRLRSSPGLSTKIIKTLSYDLVEYLETTPTQETIGGETHPWIKVRLADGMEGFLYGKFYRSPLDFRAGFQKNEAGQWQMVLLVAGD
ncbi:MAG: SH3 domain-containing protein [Lewinella sp.]|uniref:SH3 domain-containing protein n=1 Tax=Lewinella sp. TaxID=2004506 RepID=UPI003D6B3FC5